MDVVNETITTSGQWHGEREGDDKWENPWKQIGMNEDGVPLYICKAFELADENAKNVKLIFNQHGGMEVAMWNKVKETVLYLIEKGYRVDGLGWQGHLRDDKKLSLNKNSLEYLSSLIDWTHQNGLEFHVTEIDYAINEDPPTTNSLYRQSHGYANILKLLISKKDNGVVTYSSWGVTDKTNEHKFLFTEDFQPKPAILKIRETLDSESMDLVYLD
jgi:GH35 family endo-1,4-beta-xylanase